ncbi:N-formylglutamate amidohydrolase, partial [Escherichia coli]|uniref:N-formylglutamate amidohydrolase n=1 Tax=Escherichia coli TaxID=562 RepID=UPI000D432DA2
MSPTYDLMRPAVWRGGLIVSSPHSGREYPRHFRDRARLREAQLRSSEDAFVD